MKFTVTEAEAREMAQFEVEVGCDISAGPSWGIHLDKALELALNSVDRIKLIELLSEQLGKVLSPEEVEELVVGFQVKVQEKVAEKLAPRTSV
ncbi:MAG: hypothetical protein H7126_10965 [Candidatus Parcubacteria bacterium]|uniref:hypothetical protein n=1 Tax=Phormidesmis priestleyi TaxID=268141 RepID=UPI00083A992C|nr:hypothetical protein [Phormidesmis priestleyi]MBC7824383.1 hypothetical protein [Leptolyngbyaceae cyanobacterium LF-bin-113]